MIEDTFTCLKCSQEWTQTARAVHAHDTGVFLGYARGADACPACGHMYSRHHGGTTNS